MRKIIGSFLITVGLVLIGIGSYNGFEKFGNDLFAGCMVRHCDYRTGTSGKEGGRF